MKKTRLFTSAILILIFALLVCAGCKKEDKVSSISLKDHDPDSVIEMVAGGFDYSAYTLIVSYDSGNTEEIPLTEEMIAEADLFKFYQEGDKEITISYQGLQYVFKISVKRSTFGSLSFPENNVFTYDGEEHTVEVVGDLPANAVVTYPGGNTFINAGSYDVTAVISCEGYVTARLATTVKIEKAKYDMDGIEFLSKTVVYDGKTHSLAISGILPDGVSAPTYYLGETIWSGAKNAGVYAVRAVFAHSNPNYEPISSMEATLTIEKAKHNVGDILLACTDRLGKPIDGNQKIYDGAPIFVSVSSDTWLPKGTSVLYSVWKDNVPVIENDTKSPVSLTDAGTYTVTAKFLLPDELNYETLPQASITVVIHKAPYVLENVYLESDVFYYDGKAYSLKVKGAIPENLEVSYEYYLNGVLQTDGEGNPLPEVTNAGRYTVYAVFTHVEKNYEDVPAIRAELQIIQAEIDMSNVTFSENNNIIYDGKNHSLTLVGPKKPTDAENPDEEIPDEEDSEFESIYTVIPDFVKINYQYYITVPCEHKELDENGKEVYLHAAHEMLLTDANGNMITTVTDAGEYFVKVIFTVENPNYAPIESMIATFVIRKVTVDTSNVKTFGEGEYVYDGTERDCTIENLPDSVELKKKTLYRVDAAGNRTEVDVAVNCGNYVTVFEWTLKDEKNYVFAENSISRKEVAFSIVPYVIDVNRITIDKSEMTYNGNHLTPTLQIGAEDAKYLNITSNLYSDGGTAPITEAINAGKYRLEVILVLNNENCEITSTETLVFEFEILPIVINVNGLEFNSNELALEYTGKFQHPTLVAVPEHVQVSYDYYWPDENNIPGGKDAGLDIGEYICKASLRAENSNYKLEGTTVYTTRYNITPEGIDITEKVSKDIELVCTEEGYSDDYLKSLIVGDLNYSVICSGMGSYFKIDESGATQYHGSKLTDLAPGRYMSQNVIIDAKDGYTLYYDKDGDGSIENFDILPGFTQEEATAASEADEVKTRFLVNIYFIIVDPSEVIA